VDTVLARLAAQVDRRNAAVYDPREPVRLDVLLQRADEAMYAERRRRGSMPRA
jgi:hypothetical protein